MLPRPSALRRGFVFSFQRSVCGVVSSIITCSHQTTSFCGFAFGVNTLCVSCPLKGTSTITYTRYGETRARKGRHRERGGGLSKGVEQGDQVRKVRSPKCRGVTVRRSPCQGSEIPLSRGRPGSPHEAQGSACTLTRVPVTLVEGRCPPIRAGFSLAGANPPLSGVGSSPCLGSDFPCRGQRSFMGDFSKTATGVCGCFVV